MRSSLLLVALVAAAMWVGCGRRTEQTQAPTRQPEVESSEVVTEAPPPGTSQQAEETAVAAADAWLELVDAGKYEESWGESADLFQKALDKAGWGKQLSAARAPLGEVVSRTVKSTQYSTSLPGAPDGEYVVIQYDTSFDRKKSAVETITPMKETDGTWRVSGYYIN